LVFDVDGQRLGLVLIEFLARERACRSLLDAADANKRRLKFDVSKAQVVIRQVKTLAYLNTAVLGPTRLLSVILVRCVDAFLKERRLHGLDTLLLN